MTLLLSQNVIINEGESIPVAAMLASEGVPISTGTVDTITLQIFPQARANRQRVQPKLRLSPTTVLEVPEVSDGYKHNFYHLMTPAMFPGAKHRGGSTYRAEYRVDTDALELITLIVNVSVRATRSS